MPQFDFYVLNHLIIFFASAVCFVTFFLVFYVALVAFFGSQVKLLLKLSLTRETLKLSYSARWIALDADLLEQFVLSSQTSFEVLLLAALLAVLGLLVVGFSSVLRAGRFVGLVGFDVYSGGGPAFSRAWHNLSAIFVCVLVANLVGVAPFSFTMTSSLAAPLCLSLTMLLVCLHTVALRWGFRAFAGFLPAGTEVAIAPLVIIIETVSNLAKFISLGVRLFANMFAGHLLLKVFYSISFQAALSISFFLFFSEAFMTIFVLFVVALEIMIAFLQAFVFVLLSILYLKEAESFVSSH